MVVDQNIFKAYDIRGIYPDQIDEQVAEKIARGYAKLLKSENGNKRLKIVVAGDMRLSTKSLKEKVIGGLLKSGIDVVDVELLTTPTFYFAVAFYGYDGGLQVSASHNPKEFNGLKMVRAGGVPVSGETGIDTIKHSVIDDEFMDAKEEGTLELLENVTNVCVREEIKEWKINLTNIKPFKIVVDAANAMGSLDIDAMFSGLPCQIVKMNFDLDGTFPVHQPDPLQEKNLEQLKQRVIDEKADLGIAPDGDGDRYFFIDEKGQTIRQEVLRGVMAQEVLKLYPGSVVCYDIRPGRITRDLIVEAGGIPSVTRVGHSLIKEQMIREGSMFSGESSGHYFYKFSFGSFEGPSVLVMQFLTWLSKQDRPLSEAIAPYMRYSHSGEINSKVADAKAKIEEIKSRYADGKQNLLDGVTVEYDDYWFNLRSSNTESLLRLNLEATSRDLMEKKRDEVLELIRG